MVLPVTIAGAALAPAAFAASPRVGAPTTTTLQVTPNRPGMIAGTILTLTATVRSATAPAAPGGIGVLTITQDGTDVASAPVVVSAGATSVEATLTAKVKLMAGGRYTFQAHFGPTVADPSDYDVSDSVPVTATIVKVPTRIVMTMTPPAWVPVGKPITLRARVSTHGTVRFADHGKLVRAVPTTTGVASLTLVPTRGTHVYQAWFIPAAPATYAMSVSQRFVVTPGAARTLPLSAGAFGPLVALTQTRLNWNGILVPATGVYDARTIAGIKRFQGKFGLATTGVTDARTMALLAKMALPVLPRSCTSVAMSICVDKTRKLAQLVVRGRIVISLDARFGALEPGMQTREGIFRVYRKDATHVSSAFHTPMPWSMFFSGGQAVHYSKFFAAVGYNGASHGCVNTRDWNGVKAMYYQVRIGTRVVIFRS
jgi:peptidoglycan hydrolase-like protein with peptidoglycan-binding domain